MGVPNSKKKTRNGNQGISKTKKTPKVFINLEPSSSSAKPHSKISRTETRNDIKGVSSFLEARAEMASNMSRVNNSTKSNVGLLSPPMRGSYQAPSPKIRSRVICQTHHKKTSSNFTVDSIQSIHGYTESISEMRDVGRDEHFTTDTKSAYYTGSILPTSTR